MADLPVNLEAIAAARARLTLALELVERIEDAGRELAHLLADDAPLVGLGAGAPPDTAEPPAAPASAPDAPAPADPTLDEDAPPAAPPAPEPPIPPRTGAGGRGRHDGQPTVAELVPDALRELGGAALTGAVAEHIGCTRKAIAAAVRRGIPGVAYTPSPVPRKPGVLELEADPEPPAPDEDVPEQPAEPAFPANIAVPDELPAGMTQQRFTRPAPPPMSSRTRRAVEAELAQPDTPPAVPAIEQQLKLELADGPATIRVLANRLRAERATIADTVMRLVATGDLLNAGRDGSGGDVLYRLA